MIHRAMTALRVVQFACLAEEAVYCRSGGGDVKIPVIAGRTVFRSEDDFGRWTRTETRDFIVRARPYEAGDFRERKSPLLWAFRGGLRRRPSNGFAIFGGYQDLFGDGRNAPSIVPRSRGTIEG